MIVDPATFRSFVHFGSCDLHLNDRLICLLGYPRELRFYEPDQNWAEIEVIRGCFTFPTPESLQTFIDESGLLERMLERSL